MKLRPFQKEALSRLENPHHLVCVSATGSGKSLIFERIAAKPDSRTLLVTPLIALARQQESNFKKLRVKTFYGYGKENRPALHRTNRQSQPEIWIVSPEKFYSPEANQLFKNLRAWQPNFFVVDECHCLWEWGGSFRPDYARVKDLFTEIKPDRSLWLTATLTPEYQKDLDSFLPSPKSKIGRFEVPANLQLSIEKVPNQKRLGRIKDWAESSSKGIVFVPTRNAAHEWTQILTEELHLNCFLYHAGLSQEERRGTEKRIFDDRADIVVATSAFGMGMNLAQFEWVTILGATPSVLSLAQAIGRISRGGKAGRALVMWSNEDFLFLESFIRSKSQLYQVYQFLNERGCIAKRFQKYFDNQSGSDCGRCSECAEHLSIVPVLPLG